MQTVYLPVEPFDVEKVDFYVIGAIYEAQGILAPFFHLLSRIIGQREIQLGLWASTDQETAGNFTEMNEMQRSVRSIFSKQNDLRGNKGFLLQKPNLREL